MAVVNGVLGVFGCLASSFIIDHKRGVITVAYPDRFQTGLATILPGCNRTVADCSNVFDNIENYGGFPYLPARELSETTIAAGGDITRNRRT